MKLFEEHIEFVFLTHMGHRHLETNDVQFHY